MNRSLVIILLTALTLSAALCGGCAYYNTFYNAKRKFAEAERETERNRQQAAARPEQDAAQGAQPPRVVPMDKYRKVIETSAKLLEMYPKSKWVDDALLLMGISYYRMNDLARAERKFAELMTLFPNSPHIASAVIWKARTLADMKESGRAVELLNEGLPKIKAGPQRAEALYQLARLHLELGQWPEAVERFEACLREKQPRGQRINALHETGLAEFHVGNYAAARSPFSEVARVSPDLSQAYEAFVYWSRCEAALGNMDDAEAILLRVRAMERFVDFADQTDLELAGLAVREGRIDDAIAMYERFIAGSENGESRGLAFYRLAGIYREQRVNLTLSKALLDSTTRAGASKDIADSARSALAQISKGLLALDRISALLDQIHAIEGGGAQSPRPAPPQSDAAVAPEGNAVLPPPDSSLAGVTDSAANVFSVPSQILADTGRRLTPAELATDSIVKALRRQGEERQLADSLATREPVHAETAPASESSGPDDVTALRQQLQSAYLRAAEFYEFDLADHDSALYYDRLAAADPVNAEVYWKANLLLAKRLSGPGDSLTSDAERHYRAVLNADSVPIPVANQARAALHLPLIEVPVSPQLVALRAAETAQLADSVSTDSLLRLYSSVIAMDSTTPEARVALFAKAFIFEDTLRQPDSAGVIYRELLRTCPDSSFSDLLRAKLAPPDSSSPFFESDEALFPSGGETVEAILQPTQAEEGWPPPEESLRGRRFR